MSKTDLKGFRKKKQQVKTAEGRKISSIKWLQRNLNDPYVVLAKSKGYRSRAAFKLKDIMAKYPQLKQASVVVDLGCAPGGWLQVVRQLCSGARVIGVDLKEVAPIRGVELIVGDFLEEATSNELEKILGKVEVDLVLSDMAANSSGNKEIDHLRNVGLVEAALEFAQKHLRTGGNFVAKFLRGKDEPELIKKLRSNFKTVKYYKPDSSYSDSTEVFLIATSKRASLF